MTQACERIRSGRRRVGDYFAASAGNGLLVASLFFSLKEGWVVACTSSHTHRMGRVWSARASGVMAELPAAAGWGPMNLPGPLDLARPPLALTTGVASVAVVDWRTLARRPRAILEIRHEDDRGRAADVAGDRAARAGPEVVYSDLAPALHSLNREGARPPLARPKHNAIRRELQPRAQS